jgi:hypothetical protein
MARPRKPVDGDQVWRLASLGHTLRDIGRYFDVDEKTIRNRFSDEYRGGIAELKCALRVAQWKRAMAGSDTMLIWLGKCMLGQGTRTSVTSNGRPVVKFFNRADGPDQVESAGPTAGVSPQDGALA